MEVVLKSSFLDSLCNFTSTANLKININGVDVDPLKTSLPIRLAYVHQHSSLLDGTIRSNIVMSNSFNLDKMNTILNLVSLSGWVDSLHLGIDTYVGERGANISGGQVQRICLAVPFIQNHNYWFWMKLLVHLILILKLL